MHLFFRSYRLSVLKDWKYVRVKWCHRRALHRTVGYQKSRFVTNPINKINFRLCKCAYFNEGSRHQDGMFHELDDNSESTQLHEVDDLLPQVQFRKVACSDRDDPITFKLNECVSILEVLDYINTQDDLKPEHLVHTVLVLWNLQKAFYYGQCYINETVLSATTTQQYNSQIINHPKFIKLVEHIEKLHPKFDVEMLSSVLLYLQKIGVEITHPTMQMLVTELRKYLKTDLSLTTLSRFVVALFSEYNLGPFFVIQDAIPTLVRKIETCDTAEDLKLITTCMTHLQPMLSDCILKKYRDKVVEFQNNNKFSPTDYRPLLKVIHFLSHPHWNSENTILVSEIMMIMKNHLHLLQVYEFLTFYEVFFKNQEPGELLTEIQRCGSRLFLQSNDELNFPISLKVALLTSTVCFSSPLQRSEYEKLVLQCIEEPLSKQTIIEMIKILTFIKPDDQVSRKFWSNVTKCIVSQKLHKDIEFVFGICHKYMNYNSDVQFRDREFESYMVSVLKTELDNGISSIIPMNVSLSSSFILTYAQDSKLIEYVIQKLDNNWEQMAHIDCLYVSKGIRCTLDVTKNPFVNKLQLDLLNNTLDKVISNRILSKDDPIRLNFLIKCNIYRRHKNEKLFYELADLISRRKNLSSVFIKNLLYSFHTSNILLPDFIDNMADYVIDNKNNLIAFNAEKVIYFCYALGYWPKKFNELFQVVTDIIIRDQERISGLSYIQSALSLCFYNKLPDSFIRRIFNVSFMERLDVELAKCYSKDVYPIRVRRRMMQLNRAVCLDYPQANIPWFHQKYIDDLQKTGSTTTFAENKMSGIKFYLLQVIQNKDYLLENVFVPYGYQLDYLLHLDSKGALVKPDNFQEGTRIALLVLRSNAYTNIHTQLKGPFQLKMRHLEMLGYKVVQISLAEWNSLYYGKQKLQYISDLIWPPSKASERILEI